MTLACPERVVWRALLAREELRGQRAAQVVAAQQERLERVDLLGRLVNLDCRDRSDLSAHLVVRASVSAWVAFSCSRGSRCRWRR